MPAAAVFGAPVWLRSTGNRKTGHFGEPIVANFRFNRIITDVSGHGAAPMLTSVHRDPIIDRWREPPSTACLVNGNTATRAM
jgi:hypothetical protein